MGACLSKNSGHDHANRPSTSGNILSDNANEDLDRAVALSLVEQNINGNNIEDEQLARGIQESLNLESHSRYGNGNQRHPVPMESRICAGCNTEIVSGRYLCCLNAFWHPDCFRCRACNSPISVREFSNYDGYPYHISCYKAAHHRKCHVCKHYIPTNSVGLIEYKENKIWNQKFCPSHLDDGTPCCCSCERMEPRGKGYVDLKDGRKLCLECLDSAIMDTNECQPLYIAIQKFYEGLDMKLDEKIPLFLVERKALSEAREEEKNGRHYVPERGLCLSGELIINTIFRRPALDTKNKTLDLRTQPYKLTRPCDVTAILILYGLPRMLTGSILAHEMMHAWLRLKGYQNIKPHVEEGLCQVLAHMWLESELSSSSSTSNTSRKSKIPHHFERRLGEFCKHHIESDTCHVYGDGFRECQKAVRKYGLQKTLHHIRMIGKFPL